LSLANCPRMFDIVSGRETRAAVLLAGFAPDLRVRKQPIDIDGLRLSMESQFIRPNVSWV